MGNYSKHSRISLFAFILVPAAAAALVVGCSSSSDSADDDAGGTIDAGTFDATQPGLDSGQSDASAHDSSTTDSGFDAGPKIACAPGKTYVDGDGGIQPVPASQDFGSGMSGCPGQVYFKDRASLCNPGCTPCGVDQWLAKHGTQRPKNHFWTNDNLGWSGDFTSGAECFAGPIDAGDGNGNRVCSPESIYMDAGPDADASPFVQIDDPMRVCASNTSDPFGDQYDSVGNYCNWSRCSYGFEDGGTHDVDAGEDAAPPDFDSLGGCEDNLTAGTLCCCE